LGKSCTAQSASQGDATQAGKQGLGACGCFHGSRFQVDEKAKFSNSTIVRFNSAPMPKNLNFSMYCDFSDHLCYRGFPLEHHRQRCASSDWQKYQCLF
jgi:hypothetical protein